MYIVTKQGNVKLHRCLHPSELQCLQMGPFRFILIEISSFSSNPIVKQEKELEVIIGSIIVQCTLLQSKAMINHIAVFYLLNYSVCINGTQCTQHLDPRQLERLLYGGVPGKIRFRPQNIININT